MKAYNPNTTRLTVPFYGTEAELQEMLNSVDLLASIPNQGAMYATTDNDKPAAERLRFYPKRLSRALRKGIAFRRGLLHKEVPSQLCLTESELAFLLHMTLNLFASPGSSTIHENVVNTLLDFNQDFMDKKREYLHQNTIINNETPHQPQRA